MNDKVITLFGGGGFIGRYVAQALLKTGARVRIAQRDPRQAWFLKPQGGLGQTQFIAADLTKSETVARAVAGAHGVVNLVGLLGGPMEAVHVDGARHVAKACADAKVGALVHLSAIGADPDSKSKYGRTKGEGEAAVREAFPAATILRPSIVFGREDDFVNRFAGMISAACALPLVHVVPVLRAQTKFQPIFVGDVASVVVRALDEPERFGGALFELGGPEAISMGDLQRWIARTIGRRPHFIALPDSFGSLVASAGFLPGAPITRDQWQMLQHDNVVADDARSIAAFDIEPKPLAAIAPNYLVRYRRQGRFADIDRAAAPGETFA